jgi:hypothetical protein
MTATASKVRIAGQSEADTLFKIESFKTRRDQGIAVDSRGRVFHYEAPNYYLEADVKSLDESRTENWKIGFVQVLMKSTIRSVYEGGQLNGWSFPVLPVNDSTGSEYPWSDGATGYARFGHGDDQAHAEMKDSVNSDVEWWPRRRGGRIDRSSRLTEIHRNQTFRVWLMALDDTGMTIYPLNEIEYTVLFDLTIDPNTRLPRTVAFDLRELKRQLVGQIDAAWLRAPNANDSQVFTEAP